MPLGDNNKNGYKICLQQKLYEDINTYGNGSSFSEKASDILSAGIYNRKNKKECVVKFIDLFAGLGGIRLGFEQAFKAAGLETRCVMTSEIKPHAIKALQANFEHKQLLGDITKITNEQIPEFDFLLGGFPCQAFSTAGKGHGFLDTRGTLLFEIARILKEKNPYGFILENVEGLVTHDKVDKTSEIGRTLEIIINTLEELGYMVSWKVLDSQHFGVAQARKRIYIIGSLKSKISLEKFTKTTSIMNDGNGIRRLSLREGLRLFGYPETYSLNF